jgi:hypothetical protein
MKDPRTLGRNRFSNIPPARIEELRVALTTRVGGRRHADRTVAQLSAHLDALAAGRASQSPVAARVSHRDRPAPRKSILPILPD